MRSTLLFGFLKKDKGQSDALNKGFKHCSGSIYGFLNSDDVYMPGAFKCASKILKQNQDKKIIFEIGCQSIKKIKLLITIMHLISI